MDLTLSTLLLFCLSYVNFLLAITVHEAAHAWAAYMLGDDTAYQGGQVTLNPIPHVQREPVGTIVLPVLAFTYYGVCLGWASAPYNPGWRLKHPKRAGLMSLAGPVSNIVLALFAMVLLLVGIAMGVFKMSLYLPVLGVGSEYFFFGTLAQFLQSAIYLNVILAVFNMLPIPPLDGYGVLGLFVSREMDSKMMRWAQQPGVQVGCLIGAYLLFPFIMSPVWGFFSWLFHYMLIWVSV